MSGIAHRVVRSAFGAFAFATLMAGCGEPQHGLDARERRYAGKIDGHPWDGEAPDAKGRFAAGDRASWESALRERAQRQNEYAKTR